MRAKIADMVSMAFDHIYFFVSREVQLHSQYKSSYHALWSYVSELQFRIIFLVCSVTVLAAILLYCRRLRRMSSTSSLWQYNSSPVLYNVDVIPSTDKIPVRWPNEKKLRRDFEKSDMTIKMFLCKERRRHFFYFDWCGISQNQRQIVCLGMRTTLSSLVMPISFPEAAILLFITKDH